MRRLAITALAGAALAGCGDTQVDSGSFRSFERPVDLAMGCFGRLRDVGANGTVELEDPVELSAQPLRSCLIRSRGVAGMNFPPGQEDLAGAPQLSGSMSWLEVAVQPTSGTITLLSQPEGGNTATLGQSSFTISDGDPLTPGHNPIVVGSLPIAIATDTTGCQAVTANAGSCDLSVIDLTRLALGVSEPLVRQLSVTSRPSGAADPVELLARPAALASVDLLSPIGPACAAEPQGIFYIAYPDCHVVAAVRGQTGEVVASIRFDDNGTPTIDPTAILTCPRQCGQRDQVIEGARPVALDIVLDERVGFQRLAIGLDNRPVVTIVDLDLAGLPTVVRTVELDGDIGVTDIAISSQIKMGGQRGNNDSDPGAGGVEAEFVYAVATDATVRVAEVLVAYQECDTQVDPRYLFDERDRTRMVCFGVGQPGTPPRRAGARSPGIELAFQARPVAVTIASANNTLAIGATASPGTMAGHFAYVAQSNGFITIVNVDDDNYPDFYTPSQALSSVVSHALPHQIRDGIGARDIDSINDEQERICQPAPQVNPDGVPLGGPHSDAGPSLVFATSVINENKSYLLPSGHQSLCVGADATLPVSDLTFAARVDVREKVFPDWRAVSDENWFVVWEGTLSIDGNDSVVDGPATRSGLVDIAGGGLRILDAGRPFCGAGVEPFDMVTLRGCDPARGDTQCGVGETCYIHPDATVATGACLPTDRLDTLASTCRDFLISQRRYSVFESYAGELRLHERWRELRTTPLAGCTSDTQCMNLAVQEARMVTEFHPKDDVTPARPANEDPTRAPFTYACQADPSRAPGPNRCVMTCSDDSQCDDGTLCRAGRCIEGIVPAPECTKGLQRYDLRASDQFVMIGDRTGYLHPIIEEIGTGRCVKNPAASPLLLGRFGLTAPPCSGEEPYDVTPNPCTESVVHAEVVPDYVPGTCTLATADDVIRERTTTALRFENPAMRFTMVDPTYPGDAMCMADRAGTLGDVPTVFTGYNLRFHVSSGFNGMVAGSRVVQPANVIDAPDGTIWVIDAGDIDDTNAGTPNILGQLMRFDPDSGSVFVFQ